MDPVWHLLIALVCFMAGAFISVIAVHYLKKTTISDYNQFYIRCGVFCLSSISLFLIWFLVIYPQEKADYCQHLTGPSLKFSCSVNLGVL